MKYVRFPPTVQNYDLLSHTILLGGDLVYGKTTRRDGVSFSYICTQCYGLICIAYGHIFISSSSGAVLLQVLLPEREPLYNFNTFVEHSFQHQRFKFTVSYAGRIHTELMHRLDLLQPAMFLIDPFWIKRNFHIHNTFTEIMDDHTIFPTFTFFKLHNYNFPQTRQYTGGWPLYTWMFLPTQIKFRAPMYSTAPPSARNVSLYYYTIYMFASSEPSS